MEFNEVLKKRRSTRQFTDEPVSGEQIITMLEAATAAPNACNMQSWHFYVITDNSIKNRLASEKAMAEWAATAPVIFIVCTAATKIVERFGERAEKLFAVQDTSAAIENLLLCATDLGLGGCFMGAFDHDKCREIVGIKNEHKPVAMIPVGKPATELPGRPRNPLDTVYTFVGSAEGGESNPKDVKYRKFEVKNANLPESEFDNLNLKNSTMHNLNMSGSSFDDINISGTKFWNMNMKNCSYGGLTMEGSQFGCVDLKNCIFENPCFDGTIFRNCSFKGVKFENCDTEGMTVDGIEKDISKQ